jgi:hypothetical protein
VNNYLQIIKNGVTFLSKEQVAKIDPYLKWAQATDQTGPL